MPSYGVDDDDDDPLLIKAGVLFIWKMRKRTRMIHDAASIRMGLATAIVPVCKIPTKGVMGGESEQQGRIEAAGETCRYLINLSPPPAARLRLSLPDGLSFQFPKHLAAIP